MMLELLIAFGLPARTSTPLPTPFWTGLRNLLLEGHFQETIETPDLGSGQVLARLYALGRHLDPKGKLVLHAGALEALEVLELAAPLPDLGELPQGWTAGLSSGNLSLHGLTETLEFALTARFLERVRAGEPALRISVRAVCRALLPRALPPEAPPDSDPDPSYDHDLSLSLNAPAHLVKLRAWLLGEGRRLGEQIEAHLGIPTPEPAETLARVLVLPSTAGLEGLLRDFSLEARRSIEALGRSFQALAPAIPPVYQRLPNGDLMVWRGLGSSPTWHEER